MIKSLVVAAAVGVLSALTLVAPAGCRNDQTYAVQVKKKPAKIHRDGSVTAVFWLRCKAGYNAFEYNAGVGQGSTFGSTTVGPAAGILPCDGTRHRVAVNVFPESGAYQRGWANIDVYVGIFDGGDGGDIAATDSARVWLKS